MKWNITNSFSPMNNKFQSTINPPKVEFEYLFVPNYQIQHLSFHLLNQTKEFETKIDWNFNEYGKLWNYHLQYLQYLADEEIAISYRYFVLKDISQCILNGNVCLEPYPVSLRLIHSLIFISKHQISDAVISHAILKQVHFLEKNLEFHLLANHLLENYISLCFVFAMLGNPIKLNIYLPLLISELKQQVLSDGAHYERTPTYHANLLYRLQLLYQLMEATEFKVQTFTELQNFISRMISWIKKMESGDAGFPLFNDSVLSQTPSFSALIKFAVTKQILVLELGLSSSGFRILENEFFKVIINCGEILPSFQPGHAHSDMLHFMVYQGRNLILADCGVSTYEIGSNRLNERSTKMHNTVSYNLENQSQIWQSFRIAKRAQIQILKESENTIEAEVIWHTGFRHKRLFFLDQHRIVIQDTVNSAEIRTMDIMSNFHFDIQEVELKEDQIYLDQFNIELKFEGKTDSQLENYEQAVDFNVIKTSKKVIVHFEDSLKTVIKYIV
ncbi:MAG: heparinase II/III-family protein [Saprospiraceae bacterium]|nr:heparinase II/III-family protein [Saprospiraceae bacterium]